MQKKKNTYESIYLVLTSVFACTYESIYAYLLKRVRRTHFLLLLSKSPKGAILLQSLGLEPWVICYRTFIEPL